MLFVCICNPLLAAGETRESNDRSRRHAAGVASSPAKVLASAPDVASYTIESAETNFGRLEPGAEKEIRDALVIRVFSDAAWILKLTARSTSVDFGSEAAAVSRLSWRAGKSAYVPFREAQPVLIASGDSTGPFGTPVRVSLRLSFGADDPVGLLMAELGIDLESR